MVKLPISKQSCFEVRLKRCKRCTLLLFFKISTLGCGMPVALTHSWKVSPLVTCTGLYPRCGCITRGVSTGMNKYAECVDARVACKMIYSRTCND